MIRIVLDTNILVSATIAKEGAPAQILAAWHRGEVELATSPTLTGEFADVINRLRIKKQQFMTEDELTTLQSALEASALQGSGERIVQMIEDDPDDDYVLSAALETGADYIISGDPDLHELGEHEGIKIIKPVEFLKVLMEE